MKTSAKSLAGQSQLIIPIIIVVFASAAVIATNQTLNITGLAALPGTNSSFENASLNTTADGLNVTSDLVSNGTANDMPVLLAGQAAGNISADANTSMGSAMNPTDNSTQNNTAQIENATLQETAKSPVMDVAIDVPQRITRGEGATLKAVVSNTGDSAAKNVKARWNLPDGFSVSSGNIEKDCGDMVPGDSCTSTITVHTDYSAAIGASQIKVGVNYE